MRLTRVQLHGSILDRRGTTMDDWRDWEESSCSTRFLPTTVQFGAAYFTSTSYHRIGYWRIDTWMWQDEHGTWNQNWLGAFCCCCLVDWKKGSWRRAISSGGKSKVNISWEKADAARSGGRCRSAKFSSFWWQIIRSHIHTHYVLVLACFSPPTRLAARQDGKASNNTHSLSHILIFHVLLNKWREWRLFGLEWMHCKRIIQGSKTSKSNDSTF